jgi:hypothetical protein
VYLYDTADSKEVEKEKEKLRIDDYDAELFTICAMRTFAFLGQK